MRIREQWTERSDAILLLAWFLTIATRGALQVGLLPALFNVVWLLVVVPLFFWTIYESVRSRVTAGKWPWTTRHLKRDS